MLSESLAQATYYQISAVRFNGNKHAHQLQTGLVRYMILNCIEMRLAAPVTRGFIDEKKKSSGTQGIKTSTKKCISKVIVSTQFKTDMYFKILFSKLV